VHLVGTNFSPNLDVVLAANHVKKISDIKDVGSALKWGEAPVSQPPKATAYNCGRQPATDATQVRAWNTDFSRFATASAKGSHVVENSVVPYAGLIDGAIGKNVSFC